MTDAEAIRETHAEVLAARHHLLKAARRADEWGMGETHKRLMAMLTQADVVAADFSTKQAEQEGTGARVIPMPNRDKDYGRFGKRSTDPYEKARERWAR